jgi:membrane protease YdiL (CAAX protease family)
MEKTFQVTAIKSIFHSLLGLVIFFIILISGQFIQELIPNATFAELVSSVFQIGLTLFLFSLYCKKVLHVSPKDFRLRKPQSMKLWLVCAVALPLALTGFFVFFTEGSFVISEISTELKVHLIISGIVYGSIRAAIVEEVIFRGFMMPILEARWGKLVAIFTPSFLFAIIHIPFMNPTGFMDILMLIIAGTSVGVMFSLIVYQSGSLIPAIIVHALYNIWSTLIMGYPFGNNVITYVFESDSILLTGGAYGQSASVPTIIGYIVISVLAWVLYKRKWNERSHAKSAR